MKESEKNNIIKYRIAKSHDTLNDAKIIIEHGSLNTAVNRIYYASFYSVNALFLKRNITAKTHEGVRQMLGLHFIKTKILPIDSGKFFTTIYDLRTKGDYDDFIKFDKATVKELFADAKKFISQIEKLLKEK
ncbi:MAG: HEPN domain-containing protein [Bacteroidota bacterium]